MITGTRVSLAFVFCVAVAVLTSCSQSSSTDGDGRRSATDSSPHEDEKKKIESVIPISRETTYLDGPLSDDGFVDYVAAVNNERRKGVVPAQNSVVRLLQALGPWPIPADRRDEYFRQLGIQPLPDESNYFRPFLEFASAEHLALYDDEDDRWKRLFVQHDTTTANRPWDPDEFPRAAQWLAANEKPLTLVIEASRRPRFFRPIVRGGDNPSLLSSERGIYLLVEVNAALSRRVMLRLNDGKIDEAWQDQLARHRLLRLELCAGFMPSLVLEEYRQFLIGDQAICLSGLSSAQAARFIRDLQQIPPLPNIGESLVEETRLRFLDSVTVAARFRLNKHDPSAGWILDDIVRVLRSNPAVKIQWSDVLRIGNRHFDGLRAAATLPTVAQRWERFEQLEAKVSALSDETCIEFSGAEDEQQYQRFRQRLEQLSADAGSRDEMTKWMAKLLLESYATGLPMAHDADYRVAVLQTSVALALAGYRADHGRYPGKLDDLTPKYIIQLPQDPYTGGAFLYTMEDESYWLESLGSNRNDNADSSPFEDVVMRDDRVFQSRRSRDVAALKSAGAKLGADYSGDGISNVDFRETKVRDDDLASLRGLRRELDNLTLAQTGITDAGLGHLKPLSFLQLLDLSETKISDDGLAHLGPLSRLSALDVNSTKVTSKGIAHLRRLKQLEELELDLTLVDDRGLEELKRHKRLKRLSLIYTKVTDSGLEALSGLIELRQLSVGPGVTGRGLEHLRVLPNLRFLYLIGDDVTDDGLKSIGLLQKLESLTISGFGKITERGLLGLATLANLKELQLTRTSETEAVIDRLRRALPKCTIQLNEL